MLQNPGLALAIRAYRNFKRNKKPTSIQELDRQVQTYFAHRLKMTDGSVAISDIKAKIKLERELNDQLENIFSTFHSMRFKKTNLPDVQLQELTSKCQVIVAKIERKIPRA